MEEMAPKPDVPQVAQAIAIYLSLAYPGDPPASVRSRVKTLLSLSGEEMYGSQILERDAFQPPRRYGLRLGNRFYPHMKLAIDQQPDGKGFLFRADTHDKHCCPPEGSKEHGAFCDLMGKNQEMAQQIEAAWAAAGLATFKTYLRDDLVRRRGNVKT